MIKVRTGQAQGALPFCQCDPSLFPEVFMTLVTLGFSQTDEYLQVVTF